MACSEKAMDVGLLQFNDTKNYKKEFLRGNCANVMLNALKSKRNGSDATMLKEFGLEKVVSDKETTVYDYVRMFDPSKASFVGEEDHYDSEKAVILGPSMLGT